MDINSFENTIYQNWTNHFGRPLSSAQQSGTTLLAESKYGGDKLIVLWHIGKHTFAQFDPAYTLGLEELVKDFPEDTNLTAEFIQKKWGADMIQSQDVGLSYYLYPPNLPEHSPPQPFTLRQLTEADAEAMSALQAANTPEDVDEAYVEVTHQIAFGCFLDEQLVAASSGYERTGFLDIGVLTHPGFRKKGLGKSVVGSLCLWATRQNMIAQYRHNILNTGSQNVAKSLKFRMFFRSEAINLR